MCSNKVDSFLVSGRTRRGVADLEHVQRHATVCTTSPGSSTMPTLRSTRQIRRGANRSAARGPRPTTLHAALRAGRGLRRHRAHFVRPSRSRPTSSNPVTRPDHCPTRRSTRPFLTRIDHVVRNVEQGKLDDWCASYATGDGFAQLQTLRRHQIRTEYSALMSTWCGRLEDRDADQRAPRAAKSQIQEYIEQYDGRACSTCRCAPTTSCTSTRCASARALHGSADTYYDERAAAAGHDLPWRCCSDSRSSPTTDREGYCCRSSTETIHRPPAVFFEIIERAAPRVREGNFQGVVRSDRTRPGAPGNL